jgi:uncharacterized protein YecE (DUF72 family)
MSGDCEIRVGTSGWHYKHWVGTFYPPRMPSSRMLAYYSERFDTVELNNSFYRLPSENSLVAWRESTPGNFSFAAKGSRFLTHMKKLKDAEQGLERFLNAVNLLQPKLGPIVFQLPPQWEMNLERLSEFLRILPEGQRAAFELRNATWHTPELFRLLERHNAAHCIFHLAGEHSPIRNTADFGYVRLHGPGGKYQGSYSDAALGEWAERILGWKQSLKAIYIYFDNDEAGYAAHDALRLKAMLIGPAQSLR